MKQLHQYNKFMVIFTVLGLSGLGCENIAKKPQTVKSTITRRTQHASTKPAPARQKAFGIAKSEQIPRAVRLRLPHNARSRFYGTFQLPSDRRRLLLHFYSMLSNQYGLDIFMSSQRKSHAIRLLHSVRFQYTELPEDPPIFDLVIAQILWVNPESKQTPIVRLDCRCTDGFYGPFGNNFLVVFSKGLRSKPTVQQFSYSGDHNTSQAVAVDNLDTQGRMVVTIINRYSSGEDANVRILKWDGTMFR